MRKSEMSIFETIFSTIKRFVHAGHEMSLDEVNEALALRADHEVLAGKEKLDWQTSVVDLLKLLDLDSGFQARRALAEELGFQGTFVGTQEQNIALHKLVMG